MGEIVYAGSLVEHGDIDIEVTNLVHDTVVARMIDAIENVRESKAPIERVGQRFASKFVPISLGISAVTLLVTGDLRRAITMLVIACPCAAGLATPTAVSASIGQAARKGILIKGGTHIEMAAKVDVIIFDKTGTLTEGSPKLKRFMETEHGKKKGFKECLRLAASAEQHTTHPLGLVLVAEARKAGMELDKVDELKLHPGLGISARVKNERVHVGNLRFVKSIGIEVPEAFEKQTMENFTPGESILFLVVNEQLQGAFIVQDEIRPESSDALAKLRTLGIKRVLLATGDQKVSAEYVGRTLGIQDIHAELLPAGKLELVRSLKAQGYTVAMVGDGVNDAQALAEADLSHRDGRRSLRYRHRNGGRYSWTQRSASGSRSSGDFAEDSENHLSKLRGRRRHQRRRTPGQRVRKSFAVLGGDRAQRQHDRGGVELFALGAPSCRGKSPGNP